MRRSWRSGSRAPTLSFLGLMPILDVRSSTTIRYISLYPRMNYRAEDVVHLLSQPVKGAVHPLQDKGGKSLVGDDDLANIPWGLCPGC